MFFGALFSVSPPAAPLFEEKRDIAGVTLSFYVYNPVRLHGSGAGAGLAAYDHPVNAGQVDAAQVFQQGFGRDKADACGYASQVSQTRQAMFAILHGDT